MSLRLQDWRNLLLRARFFGHAILFARPIGQAKKRERKNQSQCAQLIEKQLTEAHSPTDAHSGASKASQMELFARIVNVFKLTFLTFFFQKTASQIFAGHDNTSALF